MKDITNIILIILLIAVIAFGGFVALNIFQPPKQNKPVAPPASQPIEETVAPEPQTPTQSKVETEQANVGAGLVPAQAKQTDVGTDLVSAQTDPKIQSLINKMTSDNVTEALKAEDELVKLGKPALKELVNTLNNLEPQEDILRPEIAFLLGRFEDTEAIPALISLLENENSYIRRNAVEALGKIGGEKAVFALITRLSDSDRLVKESAISALAQTRSYQATEDLLSRLRDENEDMEIKTAIINSLSEIGDKNALSGLNEYISRIKENRPEDTGDLSLWQDNIDIAEEAIQRLSR